MLRILVLVCMASNGLGFSLNVNSLVDRGLPIVNCVMRTSGKSVLQLEDLHVVMGIRLFKVAKTSIHLDCLDGHVQSLDSLERLGDFSATFEGGKITVEGKLRLKQLSFGYKSCKCRIYHFHRRSRVNATVSSHSIKFKASYIKQGNGNCNATIESLDVDHFGDLKVTSGHLAPHWIEKRFLPMLRQYIMNTMKMMLLDEIPEFDVCKMLNFSNRLPETNSTDTCY